MIQRKTMQRLTTAVLLSCSCLLAPYYAQAEAITPPEGTLSGDTVEAHKENLWEVRLPDAKGEKRPFAIFDVYDKTNDPAGYWSREDADDDASKPLPRAARDAGAAGSTEGENPGKSKWIVASYRDLLPGEQEAITDSLSYISDMVGFANKENLPLIKLELFPDEDDNASAMSDTAIYKDNEGKLTHYITGTMLAEAIQAKDKLPAFANEDNKYLAQITIDNASEKWYMDKFPLLPSNGVESDYFGTVTHEMFHALGLGTDVVNISGDGYRIGSFAQDGEGGPIRTVLNKYEIGLRDVFGRVAYYYVDDDLEPKYADEAPLGPADEEKIPAGYKLESRSIQHITLEEYNKMSKDEIAPDKFYILRDPDQASDPSEGEEGDDEGSSALNNQQLTGYVGSQGGVYFTGKNVREVLTTDGELAELTVADGINSYTVKGGLPLNCYEGDNPAPDLSHIELQNSLMSHQNYRNWCTFMEAELALLQDLGYDVDRSKYFGKSIYNSGVENDRFSVINTKGFNSSQRHGIGLHVYGSYVDVAQQADINAAGNYSMGVRVDGVGNKVKLNSYVSANGEGGNALAVAYGKEHEVTLQKAAALVAMGKDGVAARFDFGSNELGDMAEYRGSGIDVRYRSEDEVEYYKKENPDYEGAAGWTELTNLPEAINGALVSSFNVNGTLAGKQAAIYISPNAYVENINIMQGANITGDIISDWNPEAIIYQNENAEGEVSQAKLRGDNVLKPKLNSKDGLTQLSFGAQADADGDVILDDAGKPVADKSFQLAYAGNIKGADSLVMNVAGGTLSFNGAAEVKSVEIAQEATLKGNAGYQVSNGFVNNGTLAPGNSIGMLNITGDFTNNGVIAAEFMSDGTSDKIIVDGTATVNGKMQLIPLESYYSGNTKIQVVENKAGDNSKVIDNVSDANISIDAGSPVLKMQLVQNEDHTGFVISTTREENAYSQCAEDDVTRSLADGLDKNAANAKGDAQNLVAAIDFAGAKSDINAAMRKLNPAIYSSSAQATLNTHTMLNNLNTLGSFSEHEKPEALRAGGGRGPGSVVPVEPQRNSWRNIVVPFSGYMDQHDGSRGYKNHNSGVLGAMERTLDNGLTLGYHAAVNHQSTTEAGSSVKGEGLYLGTQASYAPDNWSGWSLFGSARLGVEQMRSHRNVAIGSYRGSADADWTGYSGSLRVGAALTQAAGRVKSGPFAAVDYSFVHRPQVTENGEAVRTHLDSATYDSLRTQLGYQLSTTPKALGSYDSTQWQAHFSAAWNHELLSDNGTTSYTLADLPGAAVNDKAKLYGRDSLGLLAGVTFRTPKNLDVTLNLGSDIYRRGGSAVYGKVGLEWKF